LAEASIEPLYFSPPKRAIKAEAAPTDEGFVAYAGSVGDREVRDHLGKGMESCEKGSSPRFHR